MGPGCFYPGNTRTLPSPAHQVWLQWGRDVSIPEIFPWFGGKSRVAALQWGRDVSIPEIDGTTVEARGISMLQWGRDVSIPEIGRVEWAVDRSEEHTSELQS